MRFVRMIFLGLVAIVLIVLALANRDIVGVRLVPDELAWLFGGHTFNVNLPVFLIILLALVAGIVVGLLWEWARESRLRRESSRRAFELSRLKREARPHMPPEDDVLALLERAPAKPRVGEAAVTGPGSATAGAGQGALVVR